MNDTNYIAYLKKTAPFNNWNIKFGNTRSLNMLDSETPPQKSGSLFTEGNEALMLVQV
jgi:hypothetical protein